MNLLSNLLMPKVAGWVGGGLLAAVVALSGFGYVQTGRLNAALEVITGNKLTIQLLAESTVSTSRSNTAKDEIIKRQTQSIKDIKAHSDAVIGAYKVRIQLADESAAKARGRASTIMSLPMPKGDELVLCRAARDLLELELVK